MKKYSPYENCSCISYTGQRSRTTSRTDPTKRRACAIPTGWALLRTFPTGLSTRLQYSTASQTATESYARRPVHCHATAPPCLCFCRTDYCYRFHCTTFSLVRLLYTRRGPSIALYIIVHRCQHFSFIKLYATFKKKKQSRTRIQSITSLIRSQGGALWRDFTVPVFAGRTSLPIGWS